MIEEDNIFIKRIQDLNTKQHEKYTCFLDMYHISLARTIAKKNNFNYILDGGFDESQRQVLFILDEEFKRSNYFDVIQIRTTNKEALNGFNHRTYLGSIIKANLNRDIIGDILVLENGADIITLKKYTNIIIQSLKPLKRYEHFDFSISNIDDLKIPLIQIEEKNIIIPSYRLDNFVSDLANTSRSKALNIINQERVFINGKLTTKQAKEVKLGDVITIRGKGKFIFEEDLGLTRSKRHLIRIKQFV